MGVLQGEVGLSRLAGIKGQKVSDPSVAHSFLHPAMGSGQPQLPLGSDPDVSQGDGGQEGPTGRPVSGVQGVRVGAGSPRVQEPGAGNHCLTSAMAPWCRGSQEKRVTQACEGSKERR